MSFRVHASVALVVLSVAVVGAQKVSTPEELDKCMKGVGKANQGVQKAMTA